MPSSLRQLIEQAAEKQIDFAFEVMVKSMHSSTSRAVGGGVVVSDGLNAQAALKGFLNDLEIICNARDAILTPEGGKSHAEQHHQGYVAYSEHLAAAQAERMKNAAVVGVPPIGEAIPTFTPAVIPTAAAAPAISPARPVVIPRQPGDA